MTADELLDDLGRLLREGLVYVDRDQRDTFEDDPAAMPRFYVTGKGRALSSEDPEPPA